MALLNSATSIVDFAKSRGLPSDFPSRKKLYIASGLTPEAGEYRGTAKENTDFLNYLAGQEKQSGVSISPQNVYDIIKAKIPTALTTPKTMTDPVTGQTFPYPVVPTSVLTETPTPTPTSDTTDYSDIFKTPSPEDLAQRALQMVQSGATFPLQQEAAEAEKATATLAGQKSKEELISTLASRGLFFSGKKETGLADIDADTLAKTLGVDRKFALLIASGLENAAQRIAKEAQQGNQDALSSLEALGYGVNPLTGRVEPTLQAKQAELSQAREERIIGQTEFSQQLQLSQQQLQIAQFEANQAKTEESQRIARANLSIAQERLKIAQDQAVAKGKLSAQATKELSALSGVETSINRVEQLLKEIPSDICIFARLKGYLSSGQATAGYNAAVSTYNAFRQGMLGPIARSISQEVGVLTDKDVQRAEGLLPKVTDTTAEREMKLNNLRYMIEAKRATLNTLSQFGTAGLLNPLSPYDFIEEE